MRNRKLEVRMVKTNKNEDPQSSQPDMLYTEKVAVISHFCERMFRMAAKAALAYVVLDIARQVVIAKVNQPTK